MDRVVRYQFVGRWLYFFGYCLSVVGIPLAILYLMDNTLRIETEVADAEALVEYLRQ